MKGEHRIIIQNQRVHYDFTVRRNITVIRGDSATGKTTLVDLLSQYERFGLSSGIDFSCDKAVHVLTGVQWEAYLGTMHDCIVFLDEEDTFAATDEFSEYIKKTDNYYVLISRDALSNLPYSVDEVYGIRSSGKYRKLEKTYNEFYRIYDIGNTINDIHPEEVICEDSNSGFEFFSSYFQNSRSSCVSAGGKSNVYQMAVLNERKTLVIADGAAFGPEMDKMSRLALRGQSIAFYLPESFEWVLLASDILGDKEIRDILQHPAEAIDSHEYFSWERYFLALLREKTEGTYLHYSKHHLNEAYLKGTVRQKIERFLQMGSDKQDMDEGY